MQSPDNTKKNVFHCPEKPRNGNILIQIPKIIKIFEDNGLTLKEIEDGWNLCAIKDIPMWAFHGERDDIIPISKAQAVVNALVVCGGNPLFTIYPDLYHDSWTRTYNNPDIYTWLLSKKKQ